jgi:hypothetical protein
MATNDVAIRLRVIASAKQTPDRCPVFAIARGLPMIAAVSYGSTVLESLFAPWFCAGERWYEDFCLPNHYLQKAGPVIHRPLERNHKSRHQHNHQRIDNQRSSNQQLMD